MVVLLACTTEIFFDRRQARRLKGAFNEHPDHLGPPIEAIKGFVPMLAASKRNSAGLHSVPFDCVYFDPPNRITQFVRRHSIVVPPLQRSVFRPADLFGRPLMGCMPPL